METPQSPRSHQPLPPFRRDLQLFRGPDSADGSPTFNLYDPVKEQYYKLGWAEATIMQSAEPGMSADALLHKLERETTIVITPETLAQFYEQALKMGLLHIPRAADHLLKEYENSQHGIVTKLLLNYLFFRIPLVNPDHFLQRTLKYVQPLLSRKALMVYSAIAFWGFVLAISRWDEFIHTFTYFFNPTGFVAYVLGIFAAKLIHELAHAYTAKRYGLHVTSMGVAFLVLVPVLFTDATDAWKLASRAKRMAITSAGIIAELALAGFATVLWAFSDPGPWQSTCFVLASVTWVSSLFINANPAVRFDGYYALSDWLGVENLQDRSFALLRRRFYYNFFGLKITEPEHGLPQSTRYMMVAYAIYTFLYRVILYTAIALFVYHEFTKVLGIILFAIEILLFFIWPVVYETKIYLGLRKHVTWNPRSIITISAASLLVAWTVLPLPHIYSFVAITIPYNLQAIYVPDSGRIVEVFVERGQKVEANTPIVRIDSYPLYNKHEQVQVDHEIASKKTEITTIDESAHALYSQKKAEQLQVERELQKLQKREHLFDIRAQYPGYVMDWNELMRAGVDVKTSTTLGVIADSDRLDVVCFVPERDHNWIKEGMHVSFRPRHSFTTLKGAVVQIKSSRATTLSYPALSSTHRGPLPTVQQEKEYVLLESYYEVRVKLAERDSLKFGEAGHIEVYGPWSSPLIRGLQHVMSVLYQESGL